jgi:glycosyltransferase involved in cell wall biosynthesis
MRILAHIHTFNDADIIEETIEAIERQNRLPDSMIIVDNASVDGTLDKVRTGIATIRHSQNLGTSGAVYSGFVYALDHGFDWIWIFDADSRPKSDALQTLLGLYTSWSCDLQQKIAFLACLPRDARDGKPYHGNVFSRAGLMAVDPKLEEHYYSCHTTLWSGSLYRLDAVRQIGLPNPDYVLDWGENEYGYRAMKAGLTGCIHCDAILRHNVRGNTSITRVHEKFGPVTFTLYELPAIRCYYLCRNTLYFALYDAAEGNLRLLSDYGLTAVKLTFKFFMHPLRYWPQILACLRGLWHGVTGNVGARY